MTDVTHEFKVKAGGKKGERIIAVIADDKDKTMNRRQVAEAAECTVGRVGEVVRFLAATGTTDEQELVSHLVGAPRAAKVEESKPAPAKPKAKPRKRTARKTTAKAKAAK